MDYEYNEVFNWFIGFCYNRVLFFFFIVVIEWLKIWNEVIENRVRVYSI